MNLVEPDDFSYIRIALSTTRRYLSGRNDSKSHPEFTSLGEYVLALFEYHTQSISANIEIISQCCEKLTEGKTEGERKVICHRLNVPRKNVSKCCEFLLFCSSAVFPSAAVPLAQRQKLVSAHRTEGRSLPKITAIAD